MPVDLFLAYHTDAHQAATVLVEARNLLKCGESLGPPIALELGMVRCFKPELGYHLDPIRASTGPRASPPLKLDELHGAIELAERDARKKWNVQMVFMEANYNDSGGGLSDEAVKTAKKFPGIPFVLFHNTPDRISPGDIVALKKSASNVLLVYRKATLLSLVAESIEVVKHLAAREEAAREKAAREKAGK